MTDTLTVAELLATVESAVVSAIPGPIWVRGEVVDFRRTARGAGFFRIADPEIDGRSLPVWGRGRMMMDVDHALEQAGVGRLRNGVEVRLQGTVGIDPSRANIRLSLLAVDPAFTAGRLAGDRDALLRRLAADGTLERNRRLPVPLLPLRIGLVTSRGTAAHGDFLDQLKASGRRFSVLTVQTPVQGEGSVESVVDSLDRVDGADVDVAVLVRGGGSKLDLATFDAEAVAVRIAAMSVPVMVGVGHEVDRSVADEAAAISVKTPTAAAEWLIARVDEFAARVDTARLVIAEAARGCLHRARSTLQTHLDRLGMASASLARQTDRLADLEGSLRLEARRQLDRQRQEVERLEESIGVLGPDATLRRGFAVVTDRAGRSVRSSEAVAAGELVSVRVADGAFDARVEDQ